MANIGGKAMTVLVIPAAGLSTRYNLGRPKFLLQHPKGETMLEASIRGILRNTTGSITSIQVISLASYFVKISSNALKNRIENSFGIPCEILLLEKETSSMVETVCKGIEQLILDESIIVKDCDNEVVFSQESKLNAENFITFVDLKDYPEIEAGNKSFLKINSANTLEHIIEKQIVSSLINVGAVKFHRASDFLAAAKELSGAKETYVSDVVKILLSRGHVFATTKAENYEDWGTQKEWLKYCSTFSTLFIDLDGVLVQNENSLGQLTNWSSFRVIDNNYQYLIEMYKSGRHQFVFTTARTENYRDALSLELIKLGFSEFEIITGLFHSKRFIINDFSPTNPFPTAIAINIQRDATNLSDFI